MKFRPFMTVFGDEMQSRKFSTIESVVSTAIGYVIAMCLYMVVLPMFGHKTTWTQSFNITMIFAVVSTIRGYAIRRLFNWIDK